ncbi:serine/threonine-protein kinase PLK1-like [Palaemon carinicauda]|uniref:serine/threonine-protein kinase PLK1-like n=1 Tax=Palaemon carinicauda TaxID=392227 RepID=UPI0035B5FC96
MGDIKRGDGSTLTKGANGQSGQQQAGAGRNPDVPTDCYLKELYTQITAVVTSNPDDREGITDDECTDPAAVPAMWVSKWVDYSDKYGLGYQLCDDSIGVLFNDFTKLLLLSDGETIKYIERTSMEHQHHLKNYPPALNKKVTLLRYFRNYMNEHLLKAAAAMCPREGDDKFQVPSLRTYFRTRSAIILHLTNGILQINFFEDHTKIILCPIKGAVTYIDEKRNFRTYKMTSLVKNGCRQDLANRLRYARNMIQKLLVTKAFTLRAAVGANASTASTAIAGPQHSTQTTTA